MLLAGWQCSWADYRRVPLADPELNALAAKVSLGQSGPDDAGFVTGFRGVVRLSDGRTLHLRADHAPGEPELPIGIAGIRAKFLELTTPVMGGSRAEKLLETIDSLEDLRSVSLLTDVLRSPTVGAQHGTGR